MIALFYDTWEYKQYARYGDADDFLSLKLFGFFMTAVTTMTAFSLYSESTVICVIAVISYKIDKLFYPIHLICETKKRRIATTLFACSKYLWLIFHIVVSK